MIDHLTLKVKDLDRAKGFYAQALEPLGYGVTMEFPGAVGMGEGGKSDFWLAESGEARSDHVAFSGTRAQVDAFYKAALAAGGKDNGAPGLRNHYHEHYYAAYVHDPEGNNIEVVCHDESHTG